MAFVFADGFDIHQHTAGPTVTSNRVFNMMGWGPTPQPDSASIDLAPVRVADPGCLAASAAYGQFSTQDTSWHLYLGGSNYSTIFVAFHFKMVGVTGKQNRAFFSFFDGSTEQCGFGHYNQNFTFIRNNTTVATGSTTITNNTWYWLCMKIVFHGSTGSYQLKVNNVTELTGSSANTIVTANAYCNEYAFNGWNAGGINTAYFVDNFIVYDNVNDGTALNDFITERHIITAMPGQNGDTNNFTPVTAATNLDAVSARTNFVFGSSSPAALELNYQYSTATNANDICLYKSNAAAFPTTGNYDSVQVLAVAAKTDPAIRYIRPIVKVSSTIFDPGADQKISGGYGLINKYTLALNPVTTGFWGGAALNALQFGIKIIT